MKKPILLLLKNLLIPISQAQNKIEDIRQLKMQNTDTIILQGLFVLAVASFENALNDTLRILLIHFPQKIESKLDTVTIEQLLNDTALKKAVDAKIHTISYKNIKEILEYFIKISGIHKNSFSEELLNSLKEIKATRNLLIHNNLRSNEIYLETAGIRKRTESEDFQLEITQDYLYQSILTLRSILENIQTQLNLKYSNYTKLNATRNLWNSIFTTPMLVFENEWLLDIEKDRIVSYNSESTSRQNLSSSEKYLFDLWLSHFQGLTLNQAELNFYSLSNMTRDKLSLLLHNVELVRNQQDFDRH